MRVYLVRSERGCGEGERRVPKKTMELEIRFCCCTLYNRTIFLLQEWKVTEIWFYCIQQENCICYFFTSHLIMEIRFVVLVCNINTFSKNNFGKYKKLLTWIVSLAKLLVSIVFPFYEPFFFPFQFFLPHPKLKTFACLQANF